MAAAQNKGGLCIAMACLEARQDRGEGSFQTFCSITRVPEGQDSHHVYSSSVTYGNISHALGVRNTAAAVVSESCKGLDKRTTSREELFLEDCVP